MLPREPIFSISIISPISEKTIRQSPTRSLYKSLNPLRALILLDRDSGSSAID
jgi:hypothetical protein